MASKSAVKAAPAAKAQLAVSVPATTYGIAAVDLPLDLIDEEEGFNPRGEIDEQAEDFLELVGSVREKGVRQPIEVRPGKEGRYLVTFGHRRRRAALAASMATIPAVIRAVSPVEALDAAMIENLQRANMNPMAAARGFRRMIEQRQALDPALALKDVKEQVAHTTGKSVRLIELRLQYLDLPPAKQEALEAGEISGKDATEWLRKRPKLLDLSPRQWLIALEVFDAQNRAPAPKASAHQPDAAPCRPEAREDADVEALVAHPAQMLSPVSELRDEDHERTGRFGVRFYEHRLEQLSLKYGHPVDNEDVREGLIAQARRELGMKATKPGVYSTPWLNGPFEPSKEALAAIAAEKAEREATAAEQQRQRDAAETSARERFEAGRLRLARTFKIEADVVTAWLPGDPLHPDFEATLADSGKPLPWTPTELAGVFAANGTAVFEEWPEPPPPDVVARVRLIALAVNAAVGRWPDPAPEEQGVEPDAEPFAEAGETGSEVPAEDEDEGELEDADAAADDEEIPSFLRRLAGGNPAETRA